MTPAPEPLLERDEAVDEDVVQFITDRHVYYLHTSRGRRLDIGRTHSYRPIGDPEDFYSYLWVEASQGWFVLSQRFVGGQAQPWVVYRELVPRQTMHFFLDFTDALPAYVQSHPATR